MAENIEIAAEPRDVVGKTAHSLAPSGKLPAVLYGAGVEAQAIALDRHDFERILAAHGDGSTLVHVSVAGGKSVNAIIKEVQHDPVKGTVQHVDLWAVSMKQKISAVVPIRFTGDSAGVKAGGVLTHNFTDIHIEALPGNLPEALEVDVSALEVGDSVHVGDLTPPDGVTITSPMDEIICSVTPPTIAPEAEEAAQVEEPEIVGETKEEEE
ncbi:MAG TPA: 50S ribosomal protein L25 [Coriobacteriia bacterium]|jgi:large subunit ribosomal protein L25